MMKISNIRDLRLLFREKNLRYYQQLHGQILSEQMEMKVLQMDENRLSFGSLLKALERQIGELQILGIVLLQSCLSSGWSKL